MWRWFLWFGVDFGFDLFDLALISLIRIWFLWFGVDFFGSALIALIWHWFLWFGVEFFDLALIIIVVCSTLHGPSMTFVGFGKYFRFYFELAWMLIDLYLSWHGLSFSPDVIWQGFPLIVIWFCTGSHSGLAWTCPLRCLRQARSWDMSFKLLGTGPFLGQVL